MIKEIYVNVDDIMNELKEMKEKPEILLEVDSEMETVLKEMIKIERRHLYGIDSTSHAPRRKAIQELLESKLKNKGD